MRKHLAMQSFLNNMDRLSHGLRSHPVLTTYEPGDAEAMAHAYLQAAPHLIEKRAAYALRSLCRPEHRDAFAPLTRFTHTWHIHLPLDPAILFLPDQVVMAVFPLNFEVSTSFWFSGPDYDPAGADEKVTITVDIFPGASRTAILEAFADRLSWDFPWEVDGHQPSKRQGHDLVSYMKRFAVYDLSCDGKSDAVIARQMFPTVFTDDKKPFDSSNQEYRKTMQHIKDLLKAAKSLIDNP
jgi:hypothetical protein